MFLYKENSDDQVLDLELIYVTIFPPTGACSLICLCTMVQYGPRFMTILVFCLICLCTLVAIIANTIDTDQTASLGAA